MPFAHHVSMGGFMTIWLIDWIQKTLENPPKYGISPNGSTVYSKNKEAAKKKAEDLAKSLTGSEKNDILTEKV